MQNLTLSIVLYYHNTPAMNVNVTIEFLYYQHSTTINWKLKKYEVQHRSTHMLRGKMSLCICKFVAWLIVQLVAWCKCNNVCFTVSTTTLSHFNANIVYPAISDITLWNHRITSSLIDVCFFVFSLLDYFFLILRLLFRVFTSVLLK